MKKKKPCKHRKLLISDNIMTCLFTGECLSCGKVRGAYKTITQLKKEMRKK